MTATAPVCYWLDRSDRIVDVNDAWNEFARLNGAPALQAPRVLGVWLWDAIDDGTTKQLYDALLRRVRAGERVRFGFRCDSPSLRRDMEMTLTADGDRVRFESRVVSTEGRPRQEIWNASTTRGAGLVRVCGWCKRINVADAWVEVDAGVAALRLFEAAAPPRLTHGICDDCAARVTALIDG